jgi:hypothetical protein
MLCIEVQGYLQCPEDFIMKPDRSMVDSSIVFFLQPGSETKSLVNLLQLWVVLITSSKHTDGLNSYLLFFESEISTAAVQ